MHRRQGDLLEVHPCVPTRPSKDIPGIPAARPSKDIPDIPVTSDFPVIHDIPAYPGNSTSSSIPSILQLECIFYISYNSTVQLVSTENSTEYQLDNTNYKLQTFILQRKGDVVILVRT